MELNCRFIAQLNQNYIRFKIFNVATLLSNRDIRQMWQGSLPKNKLYYEVFIWGREAERWFGAVSMRLTRGEL